MTKSVPCEVTSLSDAPPLLARPNFERKLGSWNNEKCKGNCMSKVISSQLFVHGVVGQVHHPVRDTCRRCKGYSASNFFSRSHSAELSSVLDCKVSTESE